MSNNRVDPDYLDYVTSLESVGAVPVKFSVWEKMRAGSVEAAREVFIDTKTDPRLSRVSSIQSHATDAKAYVPGMYIEPAEGLKYDDDKIRHDLLPIDAIEEISKVLTFGAKKYNDRNWEKGMRWGRLYAAILRHLFAWWKGEEADPETRLSHLAHAACCVIFLLSYQIRHGKIHSEVGNNPIEDDRP